MIFICYSNSRCIVEDAIPRISLPIDDTGSTNTNNSTLLVSHNSTQKLDSSQQNSNRKPNPSNRPNSNYKNDNISKLDDSNNKPFVLSGQFVKDPQIT